MVAVFFLKAFLAVPPGVQDMLTNLLTIALTGQVFSALLTLYALSPFLPFLIIGMFFLVVHFLTKLFCRTVKARQLASVAIKVSEIKPKNRRTKQVDKVSPSPLNTKPIVTSSETQRLSAEESKPFQHKTRRASVQEGLHLVRDMQLNHSKHPVMGVTFEGNDGSSDSDNTDGIPPTAANRIHTNDNIVAMELSGNDEIDVDILPPVAEERNVDDAHPIVPPESTTYSTSYTSGMQFSYDLSDDEENPSPVLSQSNTITTSKPKTRLVSEKELAKARIPAVWGVMSDDSGSEDDIVAQVVDINIDRNILCTNAAISISKPKARLVSEKELAKARIPAVWGVMSDDSESEDVDNFVEILDPYSV
jgi:hypothetical protein